jgi:hypothetical protein
VNGDQYFWVVRVVDYGHVQPDCIRKLVCAESTFETVLKGDDQVKAALEAIIDKVERH